MLTPTDHRCPIPIFGLQSFKNIQNPSPTEYPNRRSILDFASSVINLSVPFFSSPITVSNFVLPALIFHHPELAWEAQTVKASAIERDVLDRSLEIEIKRVVPDLEALKVLMPRGDEASVASVRARQPSAATSQRPHAEAESGGGRLVAT
jgi:hypothetical protein